MRPSELYDILFRHYGPQRWWPGDSPFEVMVGAILTQHTAWGNVERAIEYLKAAGMLEPGRIAAAGPELEDAIRPSGFYRQKSGYLRALCSHIVARYGGDPDAMLSKSVGDLRPELLALPGIGPETADAILLYAGGKPTFVVDAYTVRICGRTGMLDSAKYDEVKAFFEGRLEREPCIYNEFHALLVRLGKEHCRANRPLCDGCPVRKCCALTSGTAAVPGSRRQR